MIRENGIGFDVSDIFFDGKMFQKHLNTDYIGRSFLYVPVCGSTMEMAAKLDSEFSLCSGTLVFAETQSSGKGRKARAWYSESRKNICCTIVFRAIALGEHDFAKINMALCVAIVKASEKQNVECKVKWPNDVYVDKKKLSGILIDSNICGNQVVVFAGIGVNVNESMVKNEKYGSMDSSMNPISIKDIVGKNTCREMFLADVCNYLERFLSMEYKQVLDVYRLYDMLSGKTWNVCSSNKRQSAPTPALVLGIADDGFLEVDYGDGRGKVSLCAEEITFSMLQ